jgi:hypothetical protein
MTPAGNCGTAGSSRGSSICHDCIQLFTDVLKILSPALVLQSLSFTFGRRRKTRQTQVFRLFRVFSSANIFP